MQENSLFVGSMNPSVVKMWPVPSAAARARVLHRRIDIQEQVTGIAWTEIAKSPLTVKQESFSRNKRWRQE